MVFLEAPAFARHVFEYLGEDQYHLLQIELTNNPEVGAVMPDTGGFRKCRWADPRRGKGRRGGLRIIYYYFLSDSQILLAMIYDKNEAVDLTPKEKNTLQTAIETELKARQAKKARGRTLGSKQ